MRWISAVVACVSGPLAGAEGVDCSFFFDSALPAATSQNSSPGSRPAVTHFNRSLKRLLAGDSSMRVTTLQRQLLAILGHAATLPDGSRAIGKSPKLTALEKRALQAELAPETMLLQAVRVNGRGPEPMTVTVNTGEEPAPQVAVYRRIRKGWYQEEPAEVSADGKSVKFRTVPGDFVLVKKKAHPLKGSLLDQVLLHWPDPTDDPAARQSWKLYRAIPDAAVGPVPLLLIHGTGTNRWANFLDWAARSEEAEGLRANFQIWVFDQPMAGINAAIGFDPSCPTYENSIVAWLRKFLDQAITEGSVTDGVRYYWPPGPFAILTNSSGGLKALAFMNNYPDWGQQVLACINLGAPMLGSPLATIEWGRHTVSRMGIGKLNLAAAVLENLIQINYFSVKNQSDLDNGWGNFDEPAGQGIPYRHFQAWSIERKWHPRVLSPRDANVSWARTRPDYADDNTFEPDVPLPNYCGGLDSIIPSGRGENFLDRFYLYAGYIRDAEGLADIAVRSDDDMTSFWKNLIESVGLRLTGIMMGLYESPSGRWPLTAYQLNDGFVPLQSMLACPGSPGRHFYQTRNILGWEVPAWPLEPDWDLITENTLALPEHLRIFPGWSHLEIVNGRYNRRTRHSELFAYITDDLLNSLSDKIYFSSN